MCGRAGLSSDVSEIKIVFGIPPERPPPHFAASWNVAPTDPLPIVHYDLGAGDWLALRNQVSRVAVISDAILSSARHCLR